MPGSDFLGTNHSLLWEEQGFWSRQTWACLPVIHCCVTLGKSPHLSEHVGDMQTYFMGLW